MITFSSGLGLSGLSVAVRQLGGARLRGGKAPLRHATPIVTLRLGNFFLDKTNRAAPKLSEKKEPTEADSEKVSFYRTPRQQAGDGTRQATAADQEHTRRRTEPTRQATENHIEAKP